MGMLVTGARLSLSTILGLADEPELKVNLETSGAAVPSGWNPALVPGVLVEPVVVGKLVTVVGMLVKVAEVKVKVVGKLVRVVGMLVTVLGKVVMLKGVVEVAVRGESGGQADIGVAGNVRRDLELSNYYFFISSFFDLRLLLCRVVVGESGRGEGLGGENLSNLYKCSSFRRETWN